MMKAKLICYSNPQIMSLCGDRKYKLFFSCLLEVEVIFIVVALTIEFHGTNIQF